MTHTASVVDAYDPRVLVRGSGQPIVLVPGMDGTGELFYRQVPLLAASYRVATYVLRDDVSSMEPLAGDLAHIVQRVAGHERRAIIVGESFGGAVALSTALTYPELVSELVILNSFAYFQPQLLLQLAIAGLGAMPWGAMKLVRYLTASRLHSRHTHRQEVKRFIQLTAKATRAGYLNRLQVLRQYDIRERLAEIQCPVLFLAAERDHLVRSVEQARYMTRQVRSASVRILPGHGHICLIAPDIDLTAILKEWRAVRVQAHAP